MAIGDYSNNNSRSNNNGVYEPTVYSRIRFKNDKMSLSTTYHSGLMCIEIGEFDSNDGYKTIPRGKIYLSPIKAAMLSEQIDRFLEYKNGKNVDSKIAFGVNAGMNEKVSYIGFSTNSSKENIVTIGKFDGNGVITESTRFTFSKDYNYALDWNNIESNDLNKSFMNDVEITMFKNAIYDFSRSMTGAEAYSYIDAARYENGRNFNRIDMILDKLGIERRSNNYNSGSSSNNYLNNASSSSRSMSLDDLEDQLLD